MPIKLGTIAKTLPFSKAMLGTVLKYQKASPEIAFNSCPFPTSWNEVIEHEEYEATNDFGKWIITSAVGRMSNIAPRAFDGNNSTYWSCNNSPYTIGIECPVAIKPTQVYIRHGQLGTSKLQGFNDKTGTWEDLLSISKTTSSAVNINEEISTENYYSKFQIVFTRYSSSSATVTLHEFQITSGYIKEA